MSDQQANNPANGLGSASGITYFVDHEVGMTMGDAVVVQVADDTWKATCPIGTIFGSPVEGECQGLGSTKDAALAALAEDRRRLNESLWF